jgi:hypothetical protein
MVIIIIRRFVRADREAKFLETYRAQKPTTNAAFRGETLTRVNESSEMPPGLRGLALNGPACVTYLNIAKWDSWEAFAKQFDTSGIGFDPETETAARQRVVLDVILDSSSP